MLPVIALVALVAAKTAVADFGTFDINEGELRFLAEPPPGRTHLHESRVAIGADSLQSGWVQARQCHYHLDRVPALEVVFNPKRSRNLQIVRTENIGRAWVEGASVQVERIGPDAVLCIQSENTALRRLADGSYEWHGGPYMRRFFDGYFPMQLKLAINYPASLLRVQSIDPPELQLRAIPYAGGLRFDTFFEGRLDITVRFVPGDKPPGLGW